MKLFRGPVNVCDKNDNPLDREAGRTARSTCEGGSSDTGFLCADYSPIPISDDLSYGFAFHIGTDFSAQNPNCCKCFEVQWVSGAAGEKNKRMVVQVISPGGAGGDVVAGDLIIMTPGGGLGPVGSACSAQYGSGYDW